MQRLFGGRAGALAQKSRFGCTGTPKLRESMFLDQRRRCTDVFVMTQDGPVHARTMEFGEIGQLMTVTPKENTMDALSPFQDVPGFTYTNKFGYYCMNVDIETPDGEVLWKNSCDGVNEAGLSVGGLYFPGYAGFAEVRDVGDAPRAVSNLKLVELLLGNYDNVEDIRNDMGGFIVWDYTSDETYGMVLKKHLGPGVPLAAYHWVVYDNTGAGIVIEYMNGELKIHDSIGVFTNSPNYDWHVTNVTRFDALTPNCPEGIDFGQGYGMLGAPGDWTPPGRFVRAYLQRKFMVEPRTSEQAVNSLSHVMNTVDMVNGIAVGGAAADITNWLVIKDIGKNKMYYRVYDGLNWRCVDMDFVKLELLKGEPAWDVSLPSGTDVPPVDAFEYRQEMKPQ